MVFQLKPPATFVSATHQPTTVPASTAAAPSTLAASLTNLTEAKEESIESELNECGTPPAPQPASALSTSNVHRTSRRSHSSALELLESLCECSGTNAQISDRLKCVLTNFEAQVNNNTAWGSWMTSGLGKIPEQLWPSFQQRSMDLVNLALCESKAVVDREQQKASLQLDERQRQLDQRQHDLELKQRQMELMQQQRMQEVAVQQPTQPSGQHTLLFQTVAADPTQQPLHQEPSSSTPTSGSSASTKYVLIITYGDGKIINFRLEPFGPQCFLYGIGSVPATPLTPCALVSPEDQSQTPQDNDGSA